MTPEQYLTLIKSDVRDTAGKLTDPADFEAALADALARYSDLRPRLLVEPLVGDGGAVYPLPADYALGYSTIRSIGYPDEGGTAITEPIEPETYTIGASIDGEAVLILDEPIATGSTAYLTYTAQHELEPADTVLPSDALAVCKFGAAFACLKLAAHYAQTSEPTLGADTINYQQKADMYLRLSKEFRQTANRHFGLKDDEPELLAASGYGELVPPTTTGMLPPRMFHG